jgi:hypothetical protein
MAGISGGPPRVLVATLMGEGLLKELYVAGPISASEILSAE